MEIIFYGLVAGAFFLAIANWRVGLYACILFDALRDPVRKLSAAQPVAITVAVTVIWVGVFIGVSNSHRAELLWAIRRHYPKLRAGLQCLVAALAPGAAISVALYSRGYMLAAIGGISYLAPLMALAIGFTFPRKDEDVRRLFSFYTVLNSLLMTGVLLQYGGSDMPGLGGISMDWTRGMHGYRVNLIAGFYRSPDILGLHAAHVAVFSAVLALRSKGPGRIGWSTVAVWGATCLLLAGRRKMIAIPLIFVAFYLLLGLWRGSRTMRNARIMVAIAALVTAVMLGLVIEAGVSTEYTQYASTLGTQGGTRSKELVAGSIAWTLRQSGVLGDGLGSATQGRYYAGVRTTRRGWQEDGASRLFKELGLVGVLLVGIAAVLFAQALIRAVKLTPPWHSVADRQLCLLSLVLANLCCFIASHQVYSGDPASSLFVVLLLGMVFGLPRIYWNEQARRGQGIQ